MDTLNAQPKLHDIRMVLVEAERTRGSLVELPIKAGPGMFLLSCQADHLSTEPCWTLYEGLDGVRQIWSYMNNDLEMICDIVNMSITEKSAAETNSTAAINDVNAVLSNELASTENKPWGQFGQGAAQANSWEQQQPGTSPAPDASWANTQVPPAQQWPGGAPAPGGQPNGQWPGAAPQPGMQPQQPWQDPNATSGSQFNQNQGAPQNWPGAAPVPPLANDWPSHQAQPAGANPWLNNPGAAAPAGNSGGSFLKFLTMLEGKPNITIGEVLFLSDMPPSCVDSAMRLQEMVCKSEISDKTAVEALKLAAQRGTGIVDESILSELRSRTNAAAGNSRAAITLLKDAGLITEADLNAAESAALSQNKDIGEVLVASGKTDQLILTGAVKCSELVSDAKIRSDQAIIALHYCVRARAPIEQAFEDLSIDI